MKNFLQKLYEAFAIKGGKISRTAIFLSLFSIALLGLWIFQSLFVGVEFFGWWTIPEFNTGAATAVMTIFSALYVVNHNNVTGTNKRSKQINPPKEEISNGEK